MSSNGKAAAIESTRPAAKKSACIACANDRAARRCRPRCKGAQQAQKTAGGERVLADTVTSICTPRTGRPEGPALAAGNVALRHDWAPEGGMMRAPWRLPTEGHSGRAGV